MLKLSAALLGHPALPTEVAVEWVPRAPGVIAANGGVVTTPEVWEALRAEYVATGGAVTPGRSQRDVLRLAAGVFAHTPPGRTDDVAALIDAAPMEHISHTLETLVHTGAPDELWELLAERVHSIVTTARAEYDMVAPVLASRVVPLRVRRKFAPFATTQQRIVFALTHPTGGDEDLVVLLGVAHRATTPVEFAMLTMLTDARPVWAAGLAEYAASRCDGIEKGALLGWAAELAALRVWATAPHLTNVLSAALDQLHTGGTGPPSKKGRSHTATAVLASAREDHTMPASIQSGIARLTDRWANADSESQRLARGTIRQAQLVAQLCAPEPIAWARSGRAPADRLSGWRTLMDPPPEEVRHGTQSLWRDRASDGPAPNVDRCTLALGEDPRRWRLALELDQDGLTPDALAALVDAALV